MKYALAIDIGASSGRHILGWPYDGQIKTKEIYRFRNGVQHQNGHLVWDIDELEWQVRKGIDPALSACPEIETLSIDTWGVDYVLLKDGKPIYPVYAYRDSRTEEAVAKVHEKVPFSELYSRTGCQFQSFNSIYQLYDDLEEGRLEQAEALLMIPEYLLYRLCGRMAREYTNATTMGLVNAETGGFDREILNKLGYPSRLFPELSQPGRQLLQRGRRGLQPLPEEHHGYVAGKRAEAGAVPGVVVPGNPESRPGKQMRNSGGCQRAGISGPQEHEGCL